MGSDCAKLLVIIVCVCVCVCERERVDVVCVYYIWLRVKISLSIFFDLSEPADLDKKNPESKIDETGEFVLLTDF